MLLEVLSLEIYSNVTNSFPSMIRPTCRDWPAAIDHRCINIDLPISRSVWSSFDVKP